MAGEFILTTIVKAVGTPIVNRVARPLWDRVAGPLCDPIERKIRTMLCDPIERSCYPIGNSICNMYNFKSNVEKLKKKKEKLQQKKKGVEDDVENAKRQGKSIKEEVTEWLRVANEVDERLERLERITGEGNLAWHTGFFRYSDSVEAAALIEEIAELLVENFASRKLIFDDIMETLKNPDVKAIGLHGMGGVGKTTLVKQVYRQRTQVDRLFDEVVMAEVSRTPNLIEVQGAIADYLDLKLQKESLNARASQLRQRLKEKKVLVILDDVWEELQLEELGIPFDTDDGHCRILVTSRFENVCSIMKSEKNIRVEPLCYDEAWNLFWNTVDDRGKKSQFRSIATKIVEKCDGLPVAILAIAKTLKDSDHSVWNKVSNELGNFDCPDAVPDFHPVLKLSYDYLKNEKAKSLFLLFGLHEVGHPIFIDHLVRCVFGLGFLQSVTTLKATRDEVDQLIKVLKNANLLLDSDRKNEVKVHDVIHVVAQKIAFREHKMFNIQDVDYLNEELEKDIYKDSTAISLHQREVPMLLEKLDLPQLKLLLLNSRTKYEFGYGFRWHLKISDTFLDGMKELRVLVLNEVCLRSFIPSLNYESNLRTLSLEYCNLENITKVGMLKKLEVLTFSSLDVKRLPEEIGDLTRLKLLDLEGCSELEVIPPNVISKLTRLEELYVSDSFVNWDTPDNASLTELKQLHVLTILYIHITDANIIPQDFFPEKLEGFRIFIGKLDEAECYRYEGQFDDRFGERKMALRNRNIKQCGVEKLLQKTEVLFLDEIDGIRNVHPNLDGKGFPDLKHLRIDDNPHMLHIIKHEENDCYRPFRMLETLFLCTLNNLEKLCHGDSREEPFRKLKVIGVWNCAALTQLISSSMTRLEEIRVIGCENLTEIVGSDVRDDDITISEIVFTELRTLTLERLPKLRNFGPTGISRTLENIQEGDHEDLKFLFDNKVSFPRLKNLTLYSLNIRNIWCNQLPSSYSFGETLTSLDVSDCPHLKFLFSSSMVNGLQQLEKLKVARCESMEVIINKEGSSGENNFNSISFFDEKTLCRGGLREEPFRKLKVIVVEKCAALTQLISSSMTSLEEIKVTKCENLTEIVGNDVRDDDIRISEIVFAELHTLTLGRLPKLMNFGSTAISTTLENIQEGDHEDLKSLFDNKVSFPSLKELTLSYLNIRNIWCNQLPSSYSFGETLTSLDVSDCPHLKFLFSSSMVNGLQQLGELKVARCESMKVIINKEGSSGENTFNNISFFDKKKLCHGDSREEPFRKLKVLVVERCAAFTQLIISSSMRHLEEIKVIDCENLTKIVGNDVPDDNITISEIVFTKLHTLTLGWLPSLMNFGPTAISRTLENIQEGDHEDFTLFDNKVSFPSLKNLTLHALNIRNVWCNQLPSSYSFGETLTSLDVFDCPHLKFLFSSSMVNGLQQLEELKVTRCESMEVIINKKWSSGENNFNNISFFDEKVCNSIEEIFDVPEGSSSLGGNTIPMIIFPKLTRLSLSCLRKLKSFYNGPHISEWPSLKKLSVGSCDKVEVLGSEYQSLCDKKQSVPQPLFIVDKAAFPRLEELELFENYNLKEIWHYGFSQQCLLTPKVLWFENNPNITKFPHYLLQEVDTLKVSPVCYKQIECDCDNTCAAALRQLRALTVSDLFPKYSESRDSLVSSWVSFQNMTDLKITYCNSGFRYLLTYSTATSLQHLTRLEISHCNKIEGIITPPTDEVNEKIVFTQLEYLELENLESLTSFSSGSHTLEFPSLKKMIVDRCPIMKVFSEGDLITQKLQRIQLQEYDDDEWRWEGDLNSTIQKMFKEMVGFKGLYQLRLSEVPRLKEIWHGQIAFSLFCELKFLTVDKCADMSSAIPLNLLPCLKSLAMLTIEDCDSLEEVIHVEGLDANDQSVLLPKLVYFCLIELPTLRNLWGKRHLEILVFTNLECLFVSKCNRLQYIFTTNIILGLKQLKEVQIWDCAMVETIIIEDKDAAMSDIIVPWLELITLDSLPKLTCFHSGSNILECSSLKTMMINDCPQMKAFVFTSTKDHDLQDIPLFNEKVAFPNLEELKLSKLPMVKHLWNEPCRAFQRLATIEISKCVNLKSLVSSSASLQSLTTLEVSQCDRLTSLVTLSTAKTLERLATINVADCKNMQEIITHIHIEDEENDQVAFGQLDYIRLHCLPNITGFYLGDYTIEFPALKQVVVSQCQKMNTFSKGVVSTPNLTSVQCTEDEEEGHWQNDLNTTIQLLFEEANVQSQKED